MNKSIRNPCGANRNAADAPLLKIKDIDAEYLESTIDQILKIADDVAEEYWSLDNFTCDLPGKWNLSFSIVEGKQPVAYAIVSSKSADRCHIHHFMVHRAWRGLSVGKAMLDEVEARARRAGHSTITLKVIKWNERAKKFYERNGFRTSGEESQHFLLVKLV